MVALVDAEIVVSWSLPRQQSIIFSFLLQFFRPEMTQTDRLAIQGVCSVEYGCYDLTSLFDLCFSCMELQLLST